MSGLYHWKIWQTFSAESKSLIFLSSGYHRCCQSGCWLAAPVKAVCATVLSKFLLQESAPPTRLFHHWTPQLRLIVWWSVTHCWGGWYPILQPASASVTLARAACCLHKCSLVLRSEQLAGLSILCNAIFWRVISAETQSVGASDVIWEDGVWPQTVKMWNCYWLQNLPHPSALRSVIIGDGLQWWLTLFRDWERCNSTLSHSPFSKVQPIMWLIGSTWA